MTVDKIEILKELSKISLKDNTKLVITGHTGNDKELVLDLSVSGYPVHSERFPKHVMSKALEELQVELDANILIQKNYNYLKFTISNFNINLNGIDIPVLELLPVAPRNMVILHPNFLIQKINHLTDVENEYMDYRLSDTLSHELEMKRDKAIATYEMLSFGEFQGKEYNISHHELVLYFSPENPNKYKFISGNDFEYRVLLEDMEPELKAYLKEQFTNFSVKLE